MGYSSKINPRSTGTWACGHFTHIDDYGPIKMDWQGGCGATIDQVIDDVNKFTANNSELIILNLSHLTRLVIDLGGHSRDFEPYHRLELLNKFTQLNHIYRPANSDCNLKDLLLNDFIGAGKAAVVVLFDENEGFAKNEVHSRSFFCTSQYNVTNKGIGAMQSDLQAVLSTMNPLQIFGVDSNSASVLSLTEKYQQAEFPFALQTLAEGPFPSTLSIDDVKDDAVLNMSLAITHLRLSSAGGRGPVVIYGGKHISTPELHNRINYCFDNQQAFEVTNQFLGDPWFGLPKSLAVFYFSKDGLIKGRFAREGHAIHCEQDIQTIIYGNQVIKNQSVYSRFYRALVTGTQLEINNGNLGGDPVPNVVKECKVVYGGLDSNIQDRTLREGQHFDPSGNGTRSEGPLDVLKRLFQIG